MNSTPCLQPNTLTHPKMANQIRRLAAAFRAAREINNIKAPCRHIRRACGTVGMSMSDDAATVLLGCMARDVSGLRRPGTAPLLLHSQLRPCGEESELKAEHDTLAKRFASRESREVWGERAVAPPLVYGVYKHANMSKRF